jgi:hypothetical protein
VCTHPLSMLFPHLCSLHLPRVQLVGQSVSAVIYLSKGGQCSLSCSPTKI